MKNTLQGFPLFGKLRVPITRLLAIPMGLVLMCSTSAWNRMPTIEGLLTAMGVVLVAVGSLGRLWCALYIAGQKTRSLVTQGPYSTSRNPLYFFSLVGGIGVALATETLLIPFAVALLFGIYYPYVIRREEAKLLALHGDAFKTYRKTTPCFFPDFSRLQEPEIYLAHPIAFKKEVLSSLWFLWLLAILEIFEVLNNVHLLPTFFRIY